MPQLKLTLLVVAVALSACAAPPSATVKEVLTNKAPAQFVHAWATSAEPVAEFWRGFGDAELDALVAGALQANTDVRIAAARLAEARALTLASEGLGRPTLDANAGLGRERGPDGKGGSSTGNNFGVGLASKWEIDLFGRFGFEKEAAAANVLSNAALLRATQVSVAAEVARAYFELRGQQEQLRVAGAALETQSAALKLVDARLQAGRGTALDTARANALVQTTAAAVPALEAAIARSRLRLAVLGGQLPHTAPAGAAAKALPGLPATALAQIGSPETLLRRRPDVAAAEQQLRAAQAQSGAAQSALWPTLTLSGSLGLNAGRIGDIGDPASFVYQLGASLLWNLVDNGRKKAQIGAAAARADAAQASFDKAVLVALEETESALASHTRAQQQTEALFNATQSARRAAEIARARFSAGVSDFLAVLDAERELLAAQDRLAQAQTGSATSLVAVYRALAGGWSTP